MLSRDAIVRLDKEFVWHPYTAMDDYIERVDPLVIERAEGPYLFDVDGSRYLDANASWWVSGLGHQHPRLVAALIDQASRLCHTSLAGVTHEAAARLGEALVAVAPEGLKHAFFSDDGSTALEAAIKMALGVFDRQGPSRRRLFVSLGGAFHGETLGVSALGGVPLFRGRYADVLMEVAHLRVPTERLSLDEAISGIDALFATRGEEICAVVMEPLIQGADGMRFLPPAFLQHLARRARDLGALVIVDEVFTGYGRTGTFWATEQLGLRPDLLCSAKSFSGGMLPMAVTLATDQVFDAFRGPKERAFFYGHSFSGNPLGARVALEVLSVFEDEHILAGIAPRAQTIRRAFEAMGELPGVTAARSLGMVGACNLEGGSYLGGAGWRVYEEARRRGLYLRPLGDVIYIAPALNIPEAALEELLVGVRESLEAVVAR